MPLVTFTKWCTKKEGRLLVTVNTDEVSSVEDQRFGIEMPGSLIIMKGGKKQFYVFGKHEWIVGVLEAGKKEK